MDRDVKGTRICWIDGKLRVNEVAEEGDKVRISNMTKYMSGWIQKAMHFHVGRVSFFIIGICIIVLPYILQTC